MSRDGWDSEVGWVGGLVGEWWGVGVLFWVGVVVWLVLVWFFVGSRFFCERLFWVICF